MKKKTAARSSGRFDSGSKQSNQMTMTLVPTPTRP
jgi:hypothetical protein